MNVENDKTQIIIAVTILGLGALIGLGADAKEILQMTISGLFGVATGQALSKNV